MQKISVQLVPRISFSEDGRTNRNDEVLSALFRMRIEGSVLAECDAVPDASKVRVASIFWVKQSC